MDEVRPHSRNRHRHPTNKANMPTKEQLHNHEDAAAFSWQGFFQKLSLDFCNPYRKNAFDNIDNSSDDDDDGKRESSVHSYTNRDEVEISLEDSSDPTVRAYSVTVGSVGEFGGDHSPRSLPSPEATRRMLFESPQQTRTRQDLSTPSPIFGKIDGATDEFLILPEPMEDFELKLSTSVESEMEEDDVPVAEAHTPIGAPTSPNQLLSSVVPVHSEDIDDSEDTDIKHRPKNTSLIHLLPIFITIVVCIVAVLGASILIPGAKYDATFWAFTAKGWQASWKKQLRECSSFVLDGHKNTECLFERAKTNANQEHQSCQQFCQGETETCCRWETVHKSMTKAGADYGLKIPPMKSRSVPIAVEDQDAVEEPLEIQAEKVPESAVGAPIYERFQDPDSYFERLDPVPEEEIRRTKQMKNNCAHCQSPMDSVEHNFDLFEATMEHTKLMEDCALEAEDDDAAEDVADDANVPMAAQLKEPPYVNAEQVRGKPDLVAVGTGVEVQPAKNPVENMIGFFKAITEDIKLKEENSLAAENDDVSVSMAPELEDPQYVNSEEVRGELDLATMGKGVEESGVEIEKERKEIFRGDDATTMRFVQLKYEDGIPYLQVLGQRIEPKGIDYSAPKDKFKKWFG